MALRALLFSADSSATAVLCDILTDLHVEAEICTEVLVATERLTRESYDAILVDWDQESESVQLLKSAREKRAGQALNLALVREDKDVGRALQQGANSVIKKPVDARQAEDTLSTARDLILSRRADQKEKQNKLAAVIEEAAAEAHIEEDAPGKKTGFLEQTAPRSAFEVAAQAAESEAPSDLGTGWQAARSPDERHAEREAIQEVRRPEKKRWDDHKVVPVKVEDPKKEPMMSAAPAQDSTGVVSSLAEEIEETVAEEQDPPQPKSHSQLVGFVLIACVLIAGVLYVWAPGDSYGDRLTSIWHLLPFENATKTAQAVPPAKAPEKGALETHQTKTEEPAPDSPIPTTDVDPSKIQIIETKQVPKTGAQVPPSDMPATGSDQAQAPAQTQRDTTGANVPQTNEQVPLASPLQGAPATDVPPEEPKPAVLPVAQQRPSVPLTVAENQPSISEGRTGVIIPDSLKNSPSQTAPNSYQTTVPEEISRGLITYRVDPEYPVPAQQQHLEGPVVLQVWVGKDGSVQDLKLMKGYMLLGRSAVQAVRQWRFKPYGPNGKPVDFQTSVTVNFKLPG